MPEPRRRPAVLPLALAVAAAALVGVAVVGADDVHRAEAALHLDPLLEESAVTAALRLGDGGGRPSYDADAPELPGGARELDAIAARAAASVPGSDAGQLRESLRVLDSRMTFLQRRGRVLLVRVEQPSAELAVAAADAAARQYGLSHRRWFERELGAAKRKLRAAEAAADTPARHERAAELADGADLTLELVTGSVGPAERAGAAERLASRPVRDIVVAAVLGALLGLVLLRLRRARA